LLRRLKRWQDLGNGFGRNHKLGKVGKLLG